MEIPYINFVTRQSRNLNFLHNVENSIESSGIINYDWYVIGNSTVNFKNNSHNHYLKCENVIGDYGNKINHYLDVIPENNQWVYILDDDNLLHPHFYNVFGGLDDDCQMVVFSQQIDHNCVRIANPNKMTVQQVDSAQICVSRKFIGGLRMWNVYRHDGYFLMELIIRAKEENKKVQIVQGIYSYYNAQHWL